MFVLYSCTENCSLNALLIPVAPSVVRGSPCSDDAGWMGAAAATAITGRGRRCHYGLMDGHLLSFIRIPDFKYMYVRHPCSFSIENRC